MDKKIGERLREYRKEKNLTQEELSEKLIVSRSKISSWETARRDICMTDAIKLCVNLDASLDNLFYPNEINSKEFCKIAKRYFNNKSIPMNERISVLRELHKFKDASRILELFDDTE